MKLYEVISGYKNIMWNKDVSIRTATPKDFETLYETGLATPEFQVSSNGEFMDRDEFMSAIKNPNGTFLVAELDSRIAGLIYANRGDIERAPKTQWACLVYLVIKPEFRKKGIAQELYNACIKELKNYRISRIYGWANSESDGSIVKFMSKNGFTKGHKYLWMDKEI